jgi:NOL1/NOP2/fmu family ribosome biogenesis protein
MKALNSKERKELLSKLAEHYGFTGELDYIIFEAGEKKYFVATRDVERFLGEKLRIERIGIYVFQIAHGELRLSIEGSQLVGPLATKHVIELARQQRDEWMLGKDVVLPGEYEQAFHIVRCGDDFLGCGKWKNGVLLNYVPKERYVGAAFTDEDLV